MLGWGNYESETDIQIVPLGEEELHFFGFACGCSPKRLEREIDAKPIYVHNSYDGRESFEALYETPYHRVRQEFDC